MLEAPESFKERLRERERDLLGLLDWDQAQVGMVCDSQMELDMRLGACRKEPETVEWLERCVRPDDVFYDVGACSGAYSLIAAKLRAMVYAFEPSANNYRQLVRNTLLNRLAIIGFPVALGDQTKITGFDLSSPASGAASHLITDAPLQNGHAILAYRLDDLRRTFDVPAPALIKIDVDGYEVPCLQGATETLSDAGLRSVFVEVRTDTSALINSMLEGFGFRFVRRTRRIDPSNYNVEYVRG